MGKIIVLGESLLRRIVSTPVSEVCGGVVLTVTMVGGVGLGSWWVLTLLWSWNVWLAGVATVYLAATTMASRGLWDEARAVARLLQHSDLPAARLQVARIVGRDTAQLDAAEIRRAIIETVAESASDGIVAPMFYLLLGGVPLALAYKAVNTLDSMIGHRNARYEYFGKCAARLDDLANYLPARLTALLIVCAAWLCGGDARGAWRIWQRDGKQHSSPNAGRPEAAMAGALGVRLGGRNYYAGEAYDGPYLGEPRRALEDQVVRQSLRLMLCVSGLMFLLGLAVTLTYPLA
jgi:adenosylcobinamide-phosphate synthase